MLVVNNNFVFSKTKDDVIADFDALCRTDADAMVIHHSQWSSRSGCPTPRKLYLYRVMRTGQLLSEYFHWKHRVRTRTIWMDSGANVLARWTRDPSFLKGASRRVRRHSPRQQSEKADFLTVQLNSALLTLTHFRATVSKHLCDTAPRAARVLDFSAGWGDRLTGFLASERVECITLIDPRHGSIAACKQQHRFVKSQKILRTYEEGAETALPRLASRSVDLIVTSPPYFDLEHYGETAREAKGQIRTKVRSLDEYIAVFLEPVLRHCERVLASGGTLAINIDDNPRAGVAICAPALKIASSFPSLRLLGTAGLRKGKGFGQGLHRQSSDVQAEPIYIFRKR